MSERPELHRCGACDEWVNPRSWWNTVLGPVLVFVILGGTVIALAFDFWGCP